MISSTERYNPTYPCLELLTFLYIVFPADPYHSVRIAHTPEKKKIKGAEKTSRGCGVSICSYLRRVKNKKKKKRSADGDRTEEGKNSSCGVPLYWAVQGLDGYTKLVHSKCTLAWVSPRPRKNIHYQENRQKTGFKAVNGRYMHSGSTSLNNSLRVWRKKAFPR